MARAGGRESKRLLQLLNYLGMLNFLGIVLMLVSERLPPPNVGSFPLRAVSTTIAATTIAAAATTTSSRPSNRHKGINETILFLQDQAGIEEADLMDHPRLPPWWWIEDQYGETPIVLGLDQCEQFRRGVDHPNDIIIAPTGLFNSGTNLLYQLLQLNCYFPNRTASSAYHGRAFQPPWGKHTPRESRGTYTIDSALYRNMSLKAVLPIVLIRHPYDWFKSMCDQPYGAHWKDRDGNPVRAFSESFQCPGLVHKYSSGMSSGSSSSSTTNNETYPVSVFHGSGVQEYESMAHLYNRWNRAWYDTLTVPRLMLRMEDLIFHPQRVVPSICACAGGSLIKTTAKDQKIRVPLESAKQDQSSSSSSSHGGETNSHSRRRTTFLQAVLKYGNRRTWERFPVRDHVAARAVLDKELMDTFHYQHPDWNTVLRNKKRQGLD